MKDLKEWAIRSGVARMVALATMFHQSCLFGGSFFCHNWNQFNFATSNPIGTSLLLMDRTKERAFMEIYGIVTVIWFDGTLSMPVESTDFTT
jgi:hypothetical protein